MSTSALIMMIIVKVSVTAITFYFFRRVLLTPPKPEDAADVNEMDLDTLRENDNPE